MKSIVTTTCNSIFRAIQSNTYSVQAVSSQSQIKIAFEEALETHIRPHRAINHELFQYVAYTAQNTGLTNVQFDRYRYAMFTRTYTTVPCIFELGKQAFINSDYFTGATTILNIMEEGAEGKIDLMHPLLMERSFNSLGKELFGLEPITRKACYESPTMSQAIIYRHTVEGLYKTVGPLVSYIQEFANGGNNTPQNPGMLGDMYKLFLAYRNNVDPEIFSQKIRPYFAVHISLDPKTHEQIYQGDAAEFLHGERAKIDALRQFKTPSEITAALPYMLAFLEAQACYFDAILKDVETAKNVGLPVPVRPC
jgi:hypothetical protein